MVDVNNADPEREIEESWIDYHREAEGDTEEDDEEILMIDKYQPNHAYNSTLIEESLEYCASVSRASAAAIDGNAFAAFAPTACANSNNENGIEFIMNRTDAPNTRKIITYNRICVRLKEGS